MSAQDVQQPRPQQQQPPSEQQHHQPADATLSPEEQKLKRLYGRIPTGADRFKSKKNDRKYFDSGDYMLSKSGGGSDTTVGSAHPLPENIPHSTSSSSSSSASAAAAPAKGAGSPNLAEGHVAEGSKAQVPGAAVQGHAVHPSGSSLTQQTSADEEEGEAKQQQQQQQEETRNGADGQGEDTAKSHETTTPSVRATSGESEGNVAKKARAESEETRNAAPVSQTEEDKPAGATEGGETKESQA